MAKGTLPLLLLAGAGFLIYSQTAGSMINPTPGTGPTIDPTAPDANGKTLDDKIGAFLAMIRQFESGNDYYICGDGHHFSDESTHPYFDAATGKTFPPGHVVINGQRIPTTASGAYQIIVGTWLHFADATGVYGFSPGEQDVIGRAIFESTGAQNYLAVDDFQGACLAASSQWSSMPGSKAKQNPKSLILASATYENLLA